MADCEQAKPRIFAVQARQIETWRNRSGERNMKQNRGTGLEHWTEHLLEFHVYLLGAKLNIENLLHARVNGKLYPNKINARPFVESSLQDSQMFVSPYSSIVVFCISLSLSHSISLHTFDYCHLFSIYIFDPFTFSNIYIRFGISGHGIYNVHKNRDRQNDNERREWFLLALFRSTFIGFVYIAIR